jgi:alpha-glucosidase
MNTKLILAATFLTAAVSTGFALGNSIEIKSPSGKISALITAGDHLAYSITFAGKTVVEKSSLGVTIDGKDLGQNPSFTCAIPAEEVRNTYAMIGAHGTATNHYISKTITLAGGGTLWSLEVRAFDDGVAFRYHFLDAGKHHIEGESSEWTLPIGAQIWSQSADNTSYESRFELGIVGQQPANLQIMAPATVKLPDGAGYAMMTEADLINYSDMSLMADGNHFKGFFRNDPKGWDANGEIVSPWRVTLVSAGLNGLVNSDIIKNLCPPPSAELANADWIRPGRSTWGWLSCYCGPKLEEQTNWVDRTKELGFEYYLIDDGWRDWNGGGDGAWTAMGEVVKYAKSRGVAVWVWVNAKYVHDPVERTAYFQRAKDLGIAGLKIDFPHPANVTWVNWYEDTLREAAGFHLMVDFHGAVKPTGRERTWPNEMTREGIAGREQGKSPPLHDISLPFVRYVQGHADFTPVLFMPDRLKGSSVAHELAMAVVFTSPFLCMGDNPKNYLESRAADVIKALPAVWDETVVLPGSEIGEQAAFARRSGNDWFIGVINDSTPRRETIPLKFLSKGTYKLVELADNPESDETFVRTERTVSAGDTLTLPLRKDGGYVAWLHAVPNH